MSIFARPESPPPRAPSPDHCISLNPLPIRSKRSQASIRPMSAAACNNDAQPKQKHVLRSVHSLDTSHCSSEFTPSSTNNSLLLGHDLLGRQPSKGILKPSPPPSPSFVSISSRSSTSSGRPLAHSRSLQFASPYRSPPASPTINGPPPPVPPLPAFVFTGAEKEKDDDEEKDSKEKGEKEAMKEKPKKRRHSRAGGEAKSLTSRLFSLCTSRRNVAVC
ncbi:hypothetical protein C8R42DRAFT_691109 [Lentinula raphanica]|nr:hypothetical protein C8R42DRAFT_691109 [Lentinula raphanica]